MFAVMIFVLKNNKLLILANFILLFTEEIGFTLENLMQLQNALLFHGVISNAE